MKKVHLIGNAHIDPVWLWQWQEGFAEIKATFCSALDRMKEFPHFRFTSACGAYYMWIEKSDLEMFAEIQARVKEGRWCLVGGWFIQPDCNIPCGESFARHALITQRYFLDRFGKIAETGYNVDSFGHNGNLPQILSQSGMKNYVFMRPAPHEKTLPDSPFMWESRDGSRVCTYRIPFYYNIDGDRRPFRLFHDVEQLDEPVSMAFYGVGNHGGGPTVELLRRMQAELPENFVYSDPDSYFAEVKGLDLPTVRGDLQYHAKGCYSACSEIKRNNRLAENKLLYAERMAVLSQKLAGTEYPSRELTYAWERVLFNQFHDILCGCSIREAFDDARAVHGEAMAIADRIANFACQQISWKIGTLPDAYVSSYVSTEDVEQIGIPIVVFNPLDHAVRAIVRIRDPHSRKIYKRIEDADGNPVSSQPVRDSKTDKHKKFARIFEAELPAFGYRVYRAFLSDPTEEPIAPFVITDHSIANGRIRLTFDRESGELQSFYDLRNARELLANPTEIALYDDEPNDTWAHGVEFFKDRVPCTVKGSVRVIEQGPVRAAVRTVRQFGNSTVTRDYYIYPDRDVVDVNVSLDFHEQFRIMKLRFPIATENAKAICQIPFGSIERPCDGSEQVCGAWTALTGDGGGISVATDSWHSFDAEGSTLSLTVIRSALYADHYGDRDEFCEFMEQGEHRFAYRFAPFSGLTDAQRCAEELNMPPTVVQETFHRGGLPQSYEGLRVENNNLSVTAIKRQEDGRGVLLRCYETEGRDTDVGIELLGERISFRLPHDAVRTVWVSDGNVTETDFLEEIDHMKK